MRSRDEILFRLAQEAGNLRMWLAKPGAPPPQSAPLAGLPAPRETAAALRGTPYAAEVTRLAGEILAHRFPLLGVTIETGPEIDWRRDYSSGISTEPRYFRLIPYLDAARAGDHKFVWELSRHQHWVLLAQAWLLTERQEFLDEIRAEFDTWTRQNPFLAGINWTSALEVAFRALSWIWVYHLAGDRMDDEFRGAFVAELYRHGRYLERNLSIYFSPNTHLLGEAVALHALGALFPAFPESRRWAHKGARIVQEQMVAQVHEDGGHFEQSSYYHVYALDMFLFHALLADVSPEYRERLGRMARYLADLLGPSRTLPFFGDDDGGRFFHPYGPRDRFGRATLATAAALLGESAWQTAAEDTHEQAAWWLAPRTVASTTPAIESEIYRDTGIAVMRAGDVQVVIDAGPFGPGSGGHSHSDTLSLVVRAGGEELFIDPGTYTYVGDPIWRDRFRGSAAHSTVRIDGRDQAIPAGPFRWADKPRVEILHWAVSATQDYLEAAVSYAGFEHCRRVLLVKPDLLFILDEISGPGGEHALEQFWHAGVPVQRIGPAAFALGKRAVLALAVPGADLSEGGEHGWRSCALGVKTPAPVVTVGQTTTLPAQFASMLDFAGCIPSCRISILDPDPQAIELHFEANRSGVVRFPRGAQPECSMVVPGEN